MNLHPDALDAAEREELSEAEQVQLDENARETWVRDLKWLMKGPRGRRIVRKILDDSYALEDPTVAGNAIEMARLLGFQMFGRNLFAEVIAHCPEEFVQMQQEGQQPVSDNDE